MKRDNSLQVPSRRVFLKKSALAAGGVTVGAMSFTAKSYARIIGANDRLGVALVGLGRRYGAYLPPIGIKENNTGLLYLCDVMKSQRERAHGRVKKELGYSPKLENDFSKVIADPDVDAVFLATPDHWHAPGTLLALAAGKHVYVEKPISHNPYEGELLVQAQQKHENLIIQMGNQQRSSLHTQEVIKAIHDGAIGTPYLAVAFYSNSRGRTPNQVKQAPPEGLDWELWQGPAPHRDYTHDTWDYNWHWYGWNYGTAETGNNATHELDVARWALQVDYPEEAYVEAEKRHFPDDGWEMYDTMDATFKFDGDKVIKWDGKSRNGYSTYGSGRGTIIYGPEGSVFVNRSMYRMFDRKGKLIKENTAKSKESGVQLGGGGGMTTMHVTNFFDAVRGTASQHSPVGEGVKSTLLCHLANISYRSGQRLLLNNSGKIINSDEAMLLWRREYEKGWEPKV